MVLRYWLAQATPAKFYERHRARRDTVYARYLGNFNILTYLIRHNDPSAMFLISTNPSKPRVFSVDNDVAFNGQVRTQDNIWNWQTILVDRLPRATVERLRAVPYERLRDALGVLVQFDLQNGQLVSVTPGASIDETRGVRRSGNVVQFGLTASEIADVASRLRRLLNDVDRQKIQVF